MDLIIQKTCYKCAGVGIWEGIDPCPICNGEGRVTLPPGGKPSVLSYVVTENNIFYGHEILNALDLTEYNALANWQKSNFIDVINCGTIDLNETSIGKQIIYGIFGPGTNTRANLDAMII